MGEMGKHQSAFGVGHQTQDATAGVAPQAVRAVRQQSPKHLVRRPADGRDGGDAESGVDLGASRVVDARHDVVDAEGLPSDPRRDDVGVVTAGDGGEGVGLLDARLDQGVAVESDARDGAPGEVGTEPAEGAGRADTN